MFKEKCVEVNIYKKFRLPFSYFKYNVLKNSNNGVRKIYLCTFEVLNNATLIT